MSTLTPHPNQTPSPGPTAPTSTSDPSPPEPPNFPPFTPHPVIHTPRLTLRLVTEADIPTLYAFQSNPTVTQYLTSIATSIEDTQRWYANRIGPDRSPDLQHAFTYLILLKEGEGEQGEEGKAIGTIGSRGAPALGYNIGIPEVWGKGYATEAIRGFAGAYFAAMREGEDRARRQEGVEAGKGDGSGFDKPFLAAGADERNVGSARALEKVGFKRVEKKWMDSLHGRTDRCCWLLKYRCFEEDLV